MSDQEKLAKRESIRSYLTFDPKEHLDAPKILERLPETDPAGIMHIAASQIELIAAYHNVVLDQARRSYTWASIAAFTGLIFFLASIGFIFFVQATTALIGLVSGVLIELISAMNFYLSSKSSEQLKDLQNRLDDIQRILLANSLSESLEGDYKQQARLEIIKAMLVASRQSSPKEDK